MAGKRYLNVNGELFFIYKQAAEVLDNHFRILAAKETTLFDVLLCFKGYLTDNQNPKRKSQMIANTAVEIALEELQKIKCPHLKTVKIE